MCKAIFAVLCVCFFLSRFILSGMEQKQHTTHIHKKRAHNARHGTHFHWFGFAYFKIFSLANCLSHSKLWHLSIYTKAQCSKNALVCSCELFVEAAINHMLLRILIYGSLKFLFGFSSN